MEINSYCFTCLERDCKCTVWAQRIHVAAHFRTVLGRSDTWFTKDC